MKKIHKINYIKKVENNEDKIINKKTEQLKIINKESGFVNFLSKGREIIQQKNNKILLEKKRLSNRKEGFERHPSGLNPIETPANSCSFVPESERFNTDYSQNEKINRENKNQQKIKIYEKIKNKRIENEKKRWNKIDDEFNKKTNSEKKKLDKNNSSVKYNLINLSTGNSKLDKYEKEVFDVIFF
jgi:hypothetical protein